MISGIWTKYLLNKFRKVDLAVPSAHPWALLSLRECGKMQEYEEKKSEEVLEQNAADEKAMCVRKKYGDTWLFYIQDLYDSSSI